VSGENEKSTQAWRFTSPQLELRLLRVEMWRRARLQRLINDPDIDTNDPDRVKAIRAAKFYTAVAVRRQAIGYGLSGPD
jgi:hypothetical protein